MTHSIGFRKVFAIVSSSISRKATVHIEINFRYAPHSCGTPAEKEGSA